MELILFAITVMARLSLFDKGTIRLYHHDREDRMNCVAALIRAWG